MSISFKPRLRVRRGTRGPEPPSNGRSVSAFGEKHGLHGPWRKRTCHESLLGWVRSERIWGPDVTFRDIDRALRTIAALFALGGATGMAAAAEQVLDGGSFVVRFDDAGLGPYGAPLVQGDTVIWSVSEAADFAATTTQGPDFERASFRLQVEVKPGYVLEGLQFEERGRWQADGHAVAAVHGRLLLDAGDGADMAREWQSFARRIGSADGPGSPSATWQGGLQLDLQRITGPADITLENLLSALARSPGGRRADSLAFVDLGDMRLHLQISAVPEAGSLAMMLAGLGLIGWTLRRRG